MTKLLIGGRGRTTSKSYTSKRRIILQREREIPSRDFPVRESVGIGCCAEREGVVVLGQGHAASC